MNHVSYLRVSVLFIWFLTTFLEAFKLIFSGQFCTLTYFNKWIKKQKSCIFFTNRICVIQTPCVGIKFSYCRESRELFFEKQLIQPLIHLLPHIRAVVALNNRIPGFCLPVSSALRPDSSRRFKTYDEHNCIFYFLSFPMIRLCTGYPAIIIKPAQEALLHDHVGKTEINKSIKTRKASEYS